MQLDDNLVTGQELKPKQQHKNGYMESTPQKTDNELRMRKFYGHFYVHMESLLKPIIAWENI